MSEPWSVVEPSVEHWTRLNIAVNVNIRSALLDILYDPSFGISSDEKKFYEILHSLKSEKPRLFDEEQWKIISSNPTGKISSEDLDVSMIGKLIKVLKILKPNDSMTLYFNNALEMRNDISHPGELKNKFTEEEFEKYWEKIEWILGGLGYTDMTSFHKLKSISLDKNSVEKINELSDEIYRITKNISKQFEALELSVKQQLKEQKSNSNLDFPETFPDYLPNYKEECEKFARLAKEKPEAFKIVSKYFYHLGCKIASGNKGKTFLGFDTVSKKWIAIKRCNLDDPLHNENELWKVKEVEILRNILAEVENKGHINIIDVLHFDYTDEFYFIISPIYNYTLMDFLQLKPQLMTRVEVLKQLLNVIKTLHSLHKDENIKLLHRDLKPNNIMIQVLASPNNNAKTFNIKLIDFGESYEYEDGKTVTLENVGDASWLPPTIDVTTNSHFTDIHETFVVCMLAVYILSNGEHPFINDEDATDPKKQLKDAYEKRHNIAIRECIKLDDDIKKFLSQKFKSYFAYFYPSGKLSTDSKKTFSEDLGITTISQELTEKLESLQQTRKYLNHRLMAFLPFNENRKQNFYGKQSSQPIASSVTNSTTLRNKLKDCRFLDVITKPEMPFDEFLENLDNMINKLDDIQKNIVRSSDEIPYYLFLYILTHSHHNDKAEDVCFQMPMTKKNGKIDYKDMFLGNLLNEINKRCQPKNIKIVLFYEGCRKIDKDLNIGKSEPFPSNTVVFFSTKLGNSSFFALDDERFARPGHYCEVLARNIKAGKPLRIVLRETEEELKNYHYVKNKETGNFDLRKDGRPDEGTKYLSLTPELRTEDEDILKFIF